MLLKILTIITLVGCCFSCGNRKGIITDYIEKDKGDSIFYYRDFDWCNFKGIRQIDNKHLKYPFVKMIYRDARLTLKAHFRKDETTEITFFKLQNRWCHHNCDYTISEGHVDHYFEINLDTAMLELSYSLNPLDTTHNYLSGLYELTVSKKVNDTIIQNIYNHFYEDDITRIPFLDSFREEPYQKMCNEFMMVKEYVRNDSLISGIATISAHFKLPEDEYKWRWDSRPLKRSSLFYHHFFSNKDCNE